MDDLQGEADAGQHRGAEGLPQTRHAAQDREGCRQPCSHEVTFILLLYYTDPGSYPGQPFFMISFYTYAI